MKRWNNGLRFAVGVCLAVLICIPCAWAVLYYTKPMEQVSYNLSLMTEDGQEWEGDKGWTVFTAEGKNRKKLTPDGTGGYEGLEKNGQTFYFSRKLTEKLDNPTLQLGVVNRTVSVFLDDMLIYTDCPELDNRIGYLTLPMLEYDRAEAVILSLPLDYQGRTLTIAQSTPQTGAGEKQQDSFTVYPCDTVFYCGYSYESGLIAASAKTMLPAALLFALILVLLFLFLWNAAQGKLQASLLVFAAAAFFQMCSVLVKADFFYKYTAEIPVDLGSLFFDLSVASLLACFSIYAKRTRTLLILTAGVQLISTVISGMVQTERVIPYGQTSAFLMFLPNMTGFFSLLAVILAAVVLERKKSGEKSFFHYFLTAFLGITVGYAVFLAISPLAFPDYVKNVRSGIAGDLSIGLPNRSLRILFLLCLFSGFYALAIHFLNAEAERRTKILVLEEKNRMALESYENLQRQSEEIQILRHDTMKHYLFLQRAAKEAPEKIEAYLDSLIGQAENIRPVVVSGNKLIDMILNGKLNQASGKGISVRFRRMEAPEQLPLSDKDACSLFMNILDNAIEGACSSGAEEPYLYLDLHCKENHFVFSCENSAAIQEHRQKERPIPGRGYGLKIISHIMEPYGNMVNIKQYKTAFFISVVIPLSGSAGHVSEK